MVPDSIASLVVYAEIHPSTICPDASFTNNLHLLDVASLAPYLSRLCVNYQWV